jgi:predicted TIM-barrel enzyme
MGRDDILARLRAKVADRKPIIGAGAGTGLSAKCAEAGGADLIIIYNSGRYRMAGRGSLAGLMPYGDANPTRSVSSPASSTSSRRPVSPGCRTSPPSG